MDKLDFYQEIAKDYTLLVTPAKCDPEYITATRSKVLKVVCMTLGLVCTQAAGLTEVVPMKTCPKSCGHDISR